MNDDFPERTQLPTDIAALYAAIQSLAALPDAQRLLLDQLAAKQQGLTQIQTGGVNLGIGNQIEQIGDLVMGDKIIQQFFGRALGADSTHSSPAVPPFMAPPLPDGFVARLTEFDALRSLLLDPVRERPVAITAALRGAGGYAKTTLAAALCHDGDVRAAFPDGILWVTIGEAPGDLTRPIIDLIEWLCQDCDCWRTLHRRRSALFRSLWVEKPRCIDPEPGGDVATVMLPNIDDEHTEGHTPIEQAAPRRGSPAVTGLIVLANPTSEPYCDHLPDTSMRVQYDSIDDRHVTNIRMRTGGLRMSLNAPLVYIVPDETARIAKAAFPNGNLFLSMHNELEPIYQNQDFAHRFSPTGQPAADPARLALVTAMQCVDGLSDRQAADAVRDRIAWKYALALPLDDSGFDASVLSAFRTRLLAGGAEWVLFDALLTVLREQGLLKARGRQRTDATHVLAAIRVINRLVLVAETLRHALNELADIAPAWLRRLSSPEWFERAARRIDDYRLPKGKTERAALASIVGNDGLQVLTAVAAADAPAHVQARPAMSILRWVWLQQLYAPEADRTGTCTMQWRSETDLPPAALRIHSPYDLDVRYAVKGDLTWVGYKVHLTETCDDGLRQNSVSMMLGNVFSGMLWVRHRHVPGAPHALSIV